MATFTEITITPTTATVWDHSYQRFTAYANYDDGSSIELTPTERLFETSNPGVATIDNSDTERNGRAFTVAPGTATITVTQVGQPYTATATLTVIPAPAPPTAATARFSLGFGAGLLDPAPPWTAIDTHPNLVTSYSIDRGRSYELDQTDAGHATVEILDPDGILDPTNPAGPHYGQIRPLLHAAISRRNPVTNVWEERFRGFVEEYTYDVHPSQQVNQLTVSLVDVFEIASNAEMQPGQFGTNDHGQIRYDIQTPNERIVDILTDLGIDRNRWAMLPGSVNLHTTLYSAGETPLSAIQEAADGDFPNIANVYCDRHGRICFHGRTARFDPAGVAAAVGGAWDYHHFKVGDRAAITASPTDTAQVRAFGFQRGVSRIINAATALELGVDDDAVADRRVTDPVSIGTYGTRSWSTSNLLTLGGDLTATYPTSPATETRRFAQFYVQNYAQPRDRVNSIEFRSLHPDDPRAPTTWQLLTQVDIGDTIELTVASAGGGGFTHEQYFVEGVHEDVRPLEVRYDDVTVTLDLSPRAYYTANPWAVLLTGTDPNWPSGTGPGHPQHDKNPSPRSANPKPSAHGGDHGHNGPDPIRTDWEDVGTGIDDGGDGGGDPVDLTGYIHYGVNPDGEVLGDGPVDIDTSRLSVASGFKTLVIDNSEGVIIGNQVKVTGLTCDIDVSNVIGLQANSIGITGTNNVIFHGAIIYMGDLPSEPVEGEHGALYRDALGFVKVSP